MGTGGQDSCDNGHGMVSCCCCDEKARYVRLLDNACRCRNLCHQAIFMDHASGAVASPDAESVQVGDAIWQRAEGRGLVQCAVRPVRVVEILVLAQNGPQVALVPDQRPVQQLTLSLPKTSFSLVKRRAGTRG